MDTLTQKSNSSFLVNNYQLPSAISNKIQYLNHLNSALQKYLPIEMAQHVVVANKRQHILIIAVDNSAWATKFRFIIPELLKLFAKNSELKDIQSIEWYIQHQTFSQEKPHRTVTLSCENANLIQETAASIPSLPLQKALQRLASRAKM